MSEVRISASALNRLAICPASGALPSVRGSTPQAARGTAVHRFLEEVSTLGYEQALDRIEDDELRAVCACVDLEHLPVDPNAFVPEVAFAYDFVSGKAREIGRGLGREYPSLGENEIPGTADLVGLAPDHVYVADYKWGHGPTWYAPPADWNMQLRFLALAAARTYDRDAARIELIHLRGEGQRIWRDRAELDAFALDEVALEVADVVRRVRAAATIVGAGQVPAVSTGQHCRFCPAYNACPGTTALVRLLVHEPQAVERQVAGQLTPENATRAYQAWRAAKLLVDRLGDAVFGYAQENPIPLGDGMLLGPVETSRDQVEGAIARRVLERLHGAEVADKACDFESSKAAIRRALRQVAQDTKTPLSHLERAVLDELKKCGGITIKTTWTVKEHRE